MGKIRIAWNKYCKSRLGKGDIVIDHNFDDIVSLLKIIVDELDPVQKSKVNSKIVAPPMSTRELSRLSHEENIPITEILRRSIYLYSVLNKEKNSGKKILIVNEQGEVEKEITIKEKENV